MLNVFLRFDNIFLLLLFLGDGDIPQLLQKSHKFSLNLEFINIEYARHHIDYGVVYVKLKESPSDCFWHELEYKGWVKVTGSSEILYLRELYRLEYISEEKLVIIKPIMAPGFRTAH